MPNLMAISPVLLGMFVAGCVIAILLARYLLQGPPEILEPLYPEGAVQVYTEDTSFPMSQEQSGTLMLLGIGTFGQNQVYRLLVMLDLCGLEGLVGSVLIIENETQQREQFQRRIPAIFRNRVEYGFSEAFAGGFGNRDINWTMEHIDKWGGPISSATERVIDLHRRRNRNRAPSIILSYMSLGGHWPVGLPVIQQIHEQFEESFIIAFTALPRPERLRQRYTVLKDEYEQRGVYAWVLMDNLETDPVTADFGMTTLVVALCDAALRGDQVTQINNVFSQAMGKPGDILIYQLAASDVIAYPATPQVKPARYFAFKQPIVEEVLNTLSKVAKGAGLWSVDAPVGVAGASVYDIVALALSHADRRAVQDMVTAGRTVKHQQQGQRANAALVSGDLFGQPNYDTLFASCVTVIAPDKPVCPVVVIRLIAVRDEAGVLDELIKAPSERSWPGAAGERLVFSVAASAPALTKEAAQ
jgi:hypothetical protein